MAKKKQCHEVSFNCTMHEHSVIACIVQRFFDRCAELKIEHSHDRQCLKMDLTACHCNGCPLRLDDMLAGRVTDLVHDVCGIHNTIDRRTGKLTGLFWPRYAVPTARRATSTPAVQNVPVRTKRDGRTLASDLEEDR